MRKAMATVAMLAASGTLSACVIGPGPVVSHGKPPPDPRLQQISTQDLARPASPSDPVSLVMDYLEAAAANPEDQLKTLLTYMRDKNWTPSTDVISVYRVFAAVQGGQSSDTIPVTVPMQKVGVLKEGRLETVNAGRVNVQFNVVDGPDGYMLEDVPTELMLNDEMLSDSGYEIRPVYFWDKNNERLVPDIRYVAARQSEQEKAQQLIDYLYAGPSPWLAQAVRPAAGQRPLRRNPVYTPDAKMSLDLPHQLGDDELARLATQLERTLVKSGQVSGVEFNIQGVPIQPGRAQVIDDSNQGARFAVQQGKVVRLDSRSDRAAFGVPLADAINVNVEWVMFSRREQAVALSRREGNAQRFLIGPTSAPKQVVMPGGKPVDQAAWLAGGSRSALVLSDHKLYVVTPDSDAQPTPLDGPLPPGPVMSFSVVPDGRIALVIDKKFYMAALYQNGDSLTVTQPQQIPTALDQVQHVALMRGDAVIAGLSHDVQPKLIVAVINVDGSRQQTWKEYGASEQISRLVADFRSSATAYYDYNREAIQVGRGGAVPVRETQIVRSPISPTPTTTPSGAAAEPQPITAASFEW